MNENSKTFIILTPGFPADEADSTCVPFPQLFIKSLKQVNPSLKIIVFAFQYPFVKTTYDWHGVTVIAFNGRNRGKIHRLLLWNAIRRKLNSTIKQDNVAGILNFWLSDCSLIGKWAAKKHSLKSFTWLMGQDARKGNRYFSLVKPGPESLVALSDFLAEEFFRNHGITPAHIIPPGVDEIEYDQSTMRDIDILGTGSLIPLKQYDVFIRVVARLACSRPGIKTMICGNGPEKIHLQKMIDEAGLNANIQLCGELNNTEVMMLMRRSKILLHPSSYEGFATVYTEALYAGAHVVGFCQPMGTVFKHQHIVKTEEEMVETTASLLDDAAMDHESVVTCPIATTCQKILQLYSL